jgi:hypothetical protein
VTPRPWKVRLSVRRGPWHRVDGTDDVVAVVRTPEDAIAIGALPDLVEALELIVEGCGPGCTAHGHRIAREALLKLKGEK